MILIPVHANPLLQSPSLLYTTTPKKSNPRCASSLCKYIFICLPLLSKKKIGKHLHTYTMVVTKGKIRWSLNASFKFLTLFQRHKKLKWKISIYLLSAVQITSSRYKNLKPKTRKSTHRFGRALLSINTMAQPQHIITGHMTTDHMAFLVVGTSHKTRVYEKVAHR